MFKQTNSRTVLWTICKKYSRNSSVQSRRQDSCHLLVSPKQVSQASLILQPYTSSYINFSNCLQNQVKGCGNDSVKALNRLVQNYAGETLNYVCKEYKTGNKCSPEMIKVADPNKIREEIPKSFFSLLVKIYLS